ncbi:MBL fold metallo-hydrolase [Fodinisporobacter ferrooxydans]|uniref:MBL fold metallo-hydrolase n=1 Tax=Fodinisporobacter ferrooxydans TaxID=2901836 RepID=A0ABY4CJ71_9BACL|nr:MBL fold metallo-hydrolase [Alicyclobacillaceae bacterium MYW30-H2]
MVTRCTDHVWQLSLASPTLKPATTTNTYLIHDKEEVIIVDPGFDAPANTQIILQTIQELGNPTVTGILFSHYHKDHTPGVRGLMQHLSCPIYCHELEAKQVDRLIAPCKHTSVVEQGDRIPVGKLSVDVHHTPGHTPGHLAFHIPEDAILLTGDSVISQGSTWIGPPDGHMRTYLQTLEYLKTIPAACIGPGHGPLIHDPHKAIQWFITRRLDREQQILDILRQNKSVRVSVIVERLYKDQLPADMIWVAEKTALAHLIKLEEDGLAQEIAETIPQQLSTHTGKDLEQAIPKKRNEVPDANRRFAILPGSHMEK